MTKRLTGKQRRYLRGLAHHKDPVVQIGNKGLTQAVLRQIDEALEHHELIKVKLGKDGPVSREEAAPAIEKATGAEVVQIVGRVLVVYRAREEDPEIVLPT